MEERLVSCCLIEHVPSVNARRAPAAAFAALAEQARALYVGSARQFRPPGGTKMSRI
jgi:hypothetical protein